MPQTLFGAAATAGRLCETSRDFAAIAALPPFPDAPSDEEDAEAPTDLRSRAGLRFALSSASGLSECRQLPSKKAPASTAKASCRMLPSTWQVEHSKTFRARM